MAKIIIFSLENLLEMACLPRDLFYGVGTPSQYLNRKFALIKAMLPEETAPEGVAPGASMVFIYSTENVGDVNLINFDQKPNVTDPFYDPSHPEVAEVLLAKGAPLFSLHFVMHPVMGIDVLAAEPIPAGHAIIEVVGSIKSGDAYDATTHPLLAIYTYQIGDGSAVCDASAIGNVARFMNTAINKEDANVTVYTIYLRHFVSGLGRTRSQSYTYSVRLIAFAERAIAVGEPLRVFYGQGYMGDAPTSWVA